MRASALVSQLAWVGHPGPVRLTQSLFLLSTFISSQAQAPSLLLGKVHSRITGGSWSPFTVAQTRPRVLQKGWLAVKKQAQYRLPEGSGASGSSPRTLGTY